MNKERLQIVRDEIAAHPNNFDYGVVVQINGSPISVVEPYQRTVALERLAEHKCDTLGCVAGFTLALAKRNGWEHFSVYMDDAQDILELNGLEEVFLFSGMDAFGFPSIAYHLGNDGANFPEALERLDFLIAKCDDDNLTRDTWRKD